MTQTRTLVFKLLLITLTFATIQACSDGLFQNCRECNGEACVRCAEGYSLHRGACHKCEMDNCDECPWDAREQCTQCVSGHFLTGGRRSKERSCQECTTGCNECVDTNKCLDCYSFYNLKSDGTCELDSWIEVLLWCLLAVCLCFLCFCCLLKLLVCIGCIASCKKDGPWNMKTYRRKSRRRSTVGLDSSSSSSSSDKKKKKTKKVAYYKKKSTEQLESEQFSRPQAVSQPQIVAERHYVAQPPREQAAFIPPQNQGGITYTVPQNQAGVTYAIPQQDQNRPGQL